MFTLFEKTAKTSIQVSERCGSVCDAGCRADALREHARLRALTYSWRQA